MTVQNTAIKNFAHKTSFRLDVPDGNQTRSFQLNVQESVIPGMNVEIANVALNPQLKSQISGTGVSFEPLSVRVIYDEHMEVYSELLEWMLSTVNYKDEGESTHSKFMPPFMLLHVIDNEKKKIVCTFKYYEPFPFSMSGVDFSYIEDGNMAITGEIQFAYKYFDLERDGKIVKARPNKPAEPPQRGTAAFNRVSENITLHPLHR